MYMHSQLSNSEFLVPCETTIRNLKLMKDTPICEGKMTQMDLHVVIHGQSMGLFPLILIIY